ncbi:phospholipid carrier-dependent glycosyltransferase [Nannocystaceae bacterium ST9]
MSDRLRRFVRAPGLLALLLAALTVLVLLRGERDIGYVRDEGIYFEASRRYAAWVVRWIEEGGEANTPELRDRYFGFNHEHPALMKIAGGLSARLFAEPPDPEVVAALEQTRGKQQAWQTEIAAVEGGKWPLLREGAAMRLPAILLTGFAVALLFVAGRRLGHGKLAGLLAAGWFITLPHVLFHASLHAFDVPIAVLTLIVALVWLRALRDWRFGLLLGPVLGIAIAVKHNALFLGPLLSLHLWLLLAMQWRRSGQRPPLKQWIGLPLWSMALLAPLVAVALWPWLWHDTFTRIAEYFAFHGEHSYYNTEFFGHNYNRPPLPISYPFVMTWATVPSVLLLLTAIGMLATLRAVAGRSSSSSPIRANTGDWRRPFPSGESTVEPLLYLILALFPLLLIAWPTIPIFGGTKHWLTAYPFMALLAAFAWGRLWLRARGLLTPWPRLVRVAPTLVLITALIPSAWSSYHGHPFNLSQYAPLTGGTRGAARMGLARGFWGHAVVPLLDEGDLLASGPVYLHDVHRLAVDQYRREGRWPDWQPANAGRANASLLFPEKHMLADEIELWEQLDTVAPAAMLTLDDVPVVLVYRRAGPLEAESGAGLEAEALDSDD